MTRFVFLCAGRGQRMRELTQDRCKALVPTATGAPILGHSLNSLKMVFGQEAHTITVVGGYRFASLQAWLQTRDAGPSGQVETRYNPIWAESGPLGSLLQLGDADVSDQAVCILNGDTAFDPETFEAARQMIRAGRNGLICSETPEFEADSIFVRCEAHRIHEAGKLRAAPPPLASYLVSAGFMVLSGTAATASLRAQLARLRDPAASEALKRDPWHSLVARIAAVTPMSPEIVPITTWREYDTPECLLIRTAGMRALT